ncbi:MAG TPA: Na+/H+ antiporter [Candidatus Dormibacteraeota bacterium]
MPVVAIVLGLMVAVALLALAAHHLNVPYPILLVLGGLAIALVPGLPRVELAPDTVFLVFLPPLIYAAGWFTSLRDFKANLRPIALLAVGLVLFTVGCIGVVTHMLAPDLPWAAALALGAIIAPTDPVAGTAIFQRLGVPRRIMTILEGESLLNDATGLIALNYAKVAVVTGAFSIWAAGLEFVLSGAGGVALGLALGWLVNQLMKRIQDPPIEITLSILVPYGIYLLTIPTHVSGVLAVAAAGIYAARRSPQTWTAATRIPAYAVWEVLLFVLNGLVFILIGLQLPAVIDGLAGQPVPRLVATAGIITLAVIVTRFVWVFPATYVPRFLSAAIRRRDPYPGWRNVVVIAWTGMRGVVSLAAALSLPLTVRGGAPFPGRDLILLVTFSVILVTVVLQGLSLPVLLRRLGVAADGSAMQEELEARTRSMEAAVARLDELAGEEWTREEGVAWMRMYYGKRRKHIDTQFGRVNHEHRDGGHQHEEGVDHVEAHRSSLAGHRRLRRELLDVERTTLLGLRDAGVIGDQVLFRVQRDLDLEDIQLAEA